MTLIFWLATFGFAQAAALTFEHTLVEIRAAPDAKAVVAEFRFENQTDQPVTISRCENTSICLTAQVAEGKLIYGPGEKGVIRNTFVLGNFSGTVEKAVNLWFDDDLENKPSVVLTMRVRIPELVEIAPKTLRWVLGEEPETRKFEILMEYAKPIRILSLRRSSDVFKVELVTLVEGKHYELKVTPKSTTTRCLGIIQIDTDCEMVRHRTLQGFMTVQRNSPIATIRQSKSAPGGTSQPSKWLAVVAVVMAMLHWLGLRVFQRRKALPTLRHHLKAEQNTPGQQQGPLPSDDKL